MFHCERNLSFQTIPFYNSRTCHQVILCIFSSTLVLPNLPITYVCFKRICFSRFKNYIFIVWIISIETHSLVFRTFVFNRIATIIQHPKTILHSEFAVFNLIYYIFTFYCEYTYRIPFSKFSGVIIFSCTCLISIYTLITFIEYTDLETLYGVHISSTHLFVLRT